MYILYADDKPFYYRSRKYQHSGRDREDRDETNEVKMSCAKKKDKEKTYVTFRKLLLSL